MLHSLQRAAAVTLLDQRLEQFAHFVDLLEQCGLEVLAALDVVARDTADEVRGFRLQLR